MIIWRATTSLQVKTIESTGTSVANFVIATNRKYKNRDGNLMEEAEYHRCVSYGKWADVLGQYLHKGKKIYVDGRLRTRKRTDGEWLEKFSTEIIVDNFIFLDSRGPHDDYDHDQGDLEIKDMANTTNQLDEEEIPF